MPSESPSGAAAFRVRDADWTRDRGALRSVRFDVFIVEQKVPENLEWDEADALCRHVLSEDHAGAAIGCGRLLPDGHIGRMAVRASWRGRGVGAAMLERLIDHAVARGDARVLLNAQTRAEAFYARRGFRPVGPVFEEAGIPHQAMVLELGAPARSS